MKVYEIFCTEQIREDLARSAEWVSDRIIPL